MVRFVRTAYQDSKRFTAQVSTWLMQAALQHGFPSHSFGSSMQPLGADAHDDGRTQQQLKNAQKKAKQKAKKKVVHKEQAQGGGADGEVSAALDRLEVDGGGDEDEEHKQASVLLQGNYVLKTHQYVEIARFLVEEAVAIPTELMQLIQSCVRLRNRCLKPFLAQPDASTETHKYFIDVLREVGSIFEEHRQGIAEAEALAKGQAAPVAPPANRFALLEEDLASAENEEEMPDIQLPEAPRPAKSTVSAAKVRGDLENTKDTAIESLALFFADLHSVRDYIREVWADFRNDKLDLLTASVTTNTALELLRAPHDDVMARVLPHFQQSLDLAVWTVATRAAGSPLVGYHSQWNALVQPRWSDLSPAGVKRVGYIWEWFLMPNLQILNGMAGEIGDLDNDDIVFTKPGHYGTFDPTLDFTAADFPFATKWSRAQTLIRESLGEYVALLRAPRGLLKLHVRMEPNAKAASSNPFRMDEFAIELDALSHTRKPTLLLMFASQIFIDINFDLGVQAKRGAAELNIRSQDLWNALDARDGRNGRNGSEDAEKPKQWTPEDESQTREFKRALQDWFITPDSVSSVLQAYTRRVAELAQWKSTLMERNPMMCGLLLFRLQLKFQELGLRLANAWGQIMSAAHLVVACRHSGSLPGTADPIWPDMDKVMEIHPDLFGGKVPVDVIESQSAYLRMTGASAAELRARRHQGTGIEPLAFIGFSKKGSKPLQDHTQILPIFKRRFIGDAEGTYIDVQTIELLLKDMRVRDELEESKRQRKEGAETGSSRGQRKSLRKERHHRTTKFSIVQLLSVLEAGLRRETESIRFDYVTFHITCMQILRATFDSAHPYLSKTLGRRFFQNQVQLPMITGYVLFDAMSAKREAEEEKIASEGEVVFSKLLFSTTEAINAFFAKWPKERDLGLVRLRSDSKTWDAIMAAPKVTREVVF